MRATVSVVIPAFNVSNCVERAIRSALEQTRAPDEVIVIDDQSQDSTVELVAHLAKTDSRIKLKLQPRNMGPGAARNAGIASALGDWIALLDADDCYLPERLATLLDYAEEHQLTMLADNFCFYDGHAKQVVKLAIDASLIGVRLDLDVLTFVSHCSGNSANAADFGLLKPIMRRRFLLDSGIRYDETFRHGEDFLFYFMALRAGATFALLPQPGYLYTERTGTISRRRSEVSRTNLEHARMEAKTRELAADCATELLLAAALTRRAEATRALGNMVNFHQKTLGGKLLLTVHDGNLRKYVMGRIGQKLHPSGWKL